MDEFILHQSSFDVYSGTGHHEAELEGLLTSVARIRDTAVCHIATDVDGVKNFVTDAALLY
jgi:hypothetical protein